jgi:aminopeptidase
VPTWVRSSGKADSKTQSFTIGGAAAVVASTLAIAQLKLPCVALVQVVSPSPIKCIIFVRINVVTVAPLCENLPGPSANKPGDMSVMFLLDKYH